MVMNPRTHPRGAPPDFELPSPNPYPERQTDALYWLVCMRKALEPLGRNGGTVAEKPGYHSWGSRLPNFGEGSSKTDHSIRRPQDRTGPWWWNYCSAHDWTFVDAQNGDYRTIDKYTTRLVNAMRDPKDLRPDDVYAYTLGQMDGDTVVEGYNEYTDDDETSADKTHNWHRHDSFRRNIIGIFAKMWQALTIDMGWTYDEWKRSVTPPAPAPEVTMDWDDKIQEAEGEAGDTGGLWRSFRQGFADLFNERNWWYVSDTSETPVNPPPPGSRLAQTYQRIKDTFSNVLTIKSQSASNGGNLTALRTEVGELRTELGLMQTKLDQILNNTQTPPPPA